MFQNILKQAVQHTAGLEKASIANLGSAMKSMGIEGDAGRIFRGVGLDEDSMQMKMHSALKQGAEKGMFYDEATMGGMLRNLQAGEDAMMGLNVGGMSGSSFLNNVAGQGSGLGQATAMVGLGAMAGTANMIAGGDFSEGAVVGALGGATVAGFARSMAKSGTALTDDVLKKAIGDDFLEAGNEKILQKEVKEKLIPGTRVTEDGNQAYFRLLNSKGEPTLNPEEAVITEAHVKASGLSKDELYAEGVIAPTYKKNDADQFVTDEAGNLIQEGSRRVGVGLFKKGDDSGYPLMVPRENAQLVKPKDLKMSEPLTAGDARKANLQTFRNLNEDQLQRANLTVAQRDAMLETDPSKKTNVAMRNRMLTVGGGMLSGVAFTSNKRDYRRGFNKSRGNRI